MYQKSVTFREMMTQVMLKKYEKTETTVPDLETTDLPFTHTTPIQRLSEGDPQFFSLEHAKMLKPDDIVAFKRPDVQDTVFRTLRLGKYDVHARLDLHSFTLKEARDKIWNFLKKSQVMGIRTVIIVHGKGERSVPVAAKKSFLCQWLEQIKDVQCFHSAQRHQGGTGAVYVHLRKSQEKKTALSKTPFSLFKRLKIK